VARRDPKDLRALLLQVHGPSGAGNWLTIPGFGPHRPSTDSGRRGARRLMGSTEVPASPSCRAFPEARVIPNDPLLILVFNLLKVVR